MKKSASEAFTLVELLIVIAIISILAAVIMLVIDPIEILNRARDANRLSDFNSLQKAIDASLRESTPGGVNTACGVDADPFVMCTGRSTDNILTVREIHGDGWVKANVGNQENNITMPVLPVDPVNTLNIHYTYCGLGNRYELIGYLQSKQKNSLMNDDGGKDVDRYEVGTVSETDGLLGTGAGGIECLY